MEKSKENTTLKSATQAARRAAIKNSLDEISPYNNVSPAQIWYTTAIASGNSPPRDNCSGNPEQEADGDITHITSCTEDALATSADVLGI